MPNPIPAIAYPTHPLMAQRASAAGTGAAGATATAEGAGETKGSNPLFGKDGFTFGDFLDIINPLQHIPVVSTIYRAITGDKIDPGARIAGGGLFGGPIGAVLSMVSGMVEEATGKDPGEHALAALGVDIGKGNKDAPQTMVASAGGSEPADLAAQTQAAQTQAAQLQAAQAQAAVKAPPLQVGARIVEPHASEPVRKANEKDQTSESVKTDGPIELPADLFQALKQTAAAQQADAKSAAANSASAMPVVSGNAMTAQQRPAAPMQTNAMPNTAIQAPDGRTWFPAHPLGGGGVPTRGVGAQPVGQQTVNARYGATRAGGGIPSSPQAATAAAAAAIQGNANPQQNEWNNRASEAYQKYFEMQEQKNLRTGITRGGVQPF